jgi:adenosylmethionine-8-amino-7-oxononanoate aminotransferase
LNKQESAKFLHDKLGYSRRMSAKLSDIAFLSKGNKAFEVALKNALEKAVKKGKNEKRS